jgi:hypothetical protein
VSVIPLFILFHVKHIGNNQNITSVSLSRFLSYYRAVPKKQLRQQIIRPIHLNNQKPKTESIENPPPDYLPYNMYKNLQPMQQKPDQIHPVESSHSESSGTPVMKPKKRHSKLKLTGEVDLGKDRFKMRNERRKKKKKQPVEIPEKANEVFEETSLKEQFDVSTDQVVFITSTHRPTLRLEFETSEKPLEERTLEPSVAATMTTSEYKKKLEEKAQRRQRLIQKLKALTPEERQAFLLMKQQRAEAKKKGLEFGH